MGVNRTHALDRFYRDFHVACIIQSVEDTEYINTVTVRLLNEFFDNIIWVVAVSHNILPAQKHMQPCVGHVLTYRPDTLPRIFVQKPQCRIECRTAPHLH